MEDQAIEVIATGDKIGQSSSEQEECFRGACTKLAQDMASGKAHLKVGSTYGSSTDGGPSY